MGLTPAQMWAMDLWEFNAYAHAYNKKMRDDADRNTMLAYSIAVFTNAGLRGKLKSLKHYIKPHETGVKRPQISKEEFDRKLALALAAKGR